MNQSLKRYVLQVWLLVIVTSIFLGCTKQATQIYYNLSGITGTYTGLLKMHKAYSTSSGSIAYSDSDYIASVVVKDLSGGYYSITGGNVLWIDSTHLRYKFDTTYAYNSRGPYFIRGTDSLCFNIGSWGGLPNIQQAFAGKKQ